VVLKWLRVQDAQLYKVQVARDSLFTDTVKTGNTAALTFNFFPMDKDTTYYWRVKANNGGHWSTSNGWHFNTVKRPEPPNTTGLAKALQSTERVVFPNPSRDKFIFANTKFGEVIEVYDLSGRMVKKVQAKDKSTTVDLSDQAKGNLIYKISFEHNVITEGNIILNN
jgi:hypothetical protein